MTQLSSPRGPVAPVWSLVVAPRGQPRRWIRRATIVVSGPVDANGPTEPALPGVTAAAAIVVDRGSGAKNPDLRWAPASTTKIMTGLLAVEAIAAGDVSLTDTVTIQSNVNVEGGGAALLAPGDTISAPGPPVHDAGAVHE